MPNWSDDEGNCHWQYDGHPKCYEGGPCLLHGPAIKLRPTRTTIQKMKEMRKLLPTLSDHVVNAMWDAMLKAEKQT